MKNEELLIIGGLAIAAYTLVKPLRDAGQGLATGISQTAGAIGQGTSDIIQGATSPLTIIREKTETITTRENQRQNIYSENPLIQHLLTNQIASDEERRFLKEENSRMKQQEKTERTGQDLATTQLSQKVNFKEQAQRKIEYGSSVKEYAQKMFMPTKEVAKARQDAAVNTLKKVVDTPKNAVKSAIVKTTEKAKSLIKSATKKLKR